jgi:hypothetical protein
MRKKTLIIVSVSTLAVLCWLSFQIAFFLGFKTLVKAIESSERVIFVTRSNLELEPGVRVLDANNQYFQVTRMEPNRIDVNWKGTEINLKEPRCRMKKLDSDLVHVTALLNDKQYALLIDSGCNAGLVVNDMIILDNEMEIFPFKTKDPTFAGCCHLDKIEIGDMTISNPPCLYTLNHYEKRVLGRTKWKERQIILGLGLLCRFHYILIDNIRSEVEFSLWESFKADTVEMWQCYDMSVETTEKNAKYILIHIPVAGEMTEARLDTGTSSSLAMPEDIWDDYSTKFQVLKESRERARFFYGWKDVGKITVSELSLGDKSVKEASISILDNSTFKESFILIGMGYFKDTIVVMDFEHGLLWVRKPQFL